MLTHTQNHPDDIIKPSKIQKLMNINHWYLLKIFLFFFIYLISVTISLYLDKNLSFGVLLSSPFYLVAGASLHGICLFTHEGVHKTLHKNIWINNIIGSICGYLVLQTMSGYRVLHLKHHKYLNIKGDPGLLKTYVSNKYVIAAMEWGYFLFGYAAFITVIPYQGFKQGNKKDRFLIVVDVLIVLILFGSLIRYIPFPWFLHGWLIPMIFVHFMMNIRGMSQHLMLEDYHDPFRGARTIKAHPIVDFFLCNENYHIEHHLYPSIPWYNLKKVHNLIKNKFVENNSTIIFSFKDFIFQFLNKSIKSLKT